jgi:1-deoxy-D-xylulose-5-phosphate reductoisomerase
MAVNAARRDTVSAGRRRTVSILGSTGSVGANTVDLIMRNRERFEVEALVAGGNCDKLADQARRLRPHRAVIADDARLSELRRALAGTGIETAAGRAAVLEAANQPADWVMAAIVGAAGLEPTLAAIRRGAVVALANKECLVCAGELLTAEVRRAGSRLLPVDSEHSAIFQVFDFERRDRVEKIVLTASGGPFRTLTREQMASVTPEQAVAHPNWSMGAKISVDSATMMNKGLELIEAHHLFEMPSERIDILVHPQSVVHSMVSYVDGSVLAQLGSPDMRTPIAYALAWPDRMVAPTTRLDLAAIGQLTFEPPDPKRFPGPDLARQALQQGGGAPTILNAANEIAVAGFLGRRIRFLDIIEVVARTLDRLSTTAPATLAEIRALDEEARRIASEAMPA